MDDWYYIVFKHADGNSSQSAVNFSPDVDPIPWCDAIIEAQAKGPPSMVGPGYDHNKMRKVGYEKPRRMTVEEW